MAALPQLPDDLQRQIDDLARTQNRQPAEVLADAVRRYVEEQSWVQFVENNERRAKAMGIKEDDVDRLIAEYRAENRER